MSELYDLQKSFQQFVLNGDEEFKANVDGNDDQLIKTRMGIYQNAYRLRLKGVLKIDFPGLHTIAGDQQFETICNNYIEHHPSEHFSVRHFGHEMQNFLRTTEPYSKHPILEDMASFEWTVASVLDASDGDIFSIEQLQAISPSLWPAMTINLHPSLKIIPLRWNVAKFWQCVKEDKQPETPEGYPETVNWLIWRKGTEVYFRSLEDDEAWAINSVQQGQYFAQLCEGLCDWVGPQEVANRLVSFLQIWISEQAVTSVDLNNQNSG